MKYLLIAFLVSLLINSFFVFFRPKYLLDKDDGIQKFHVNPTPRIGGVGIFASMLIISFVLQYVKGYDNQFFKLSIILFPVFFVGLIEDITKKVSPKVRLFFAAFSGVFAVFLMDAGLNRLDIVGIDYMLSNYKIVSIFFTAFALAGIANAMNIIDGFNGLASGVSIIIFLSYSYVSFIVQDMFLLYLSLVMISAILGFFLLNFPFGKIFLGDGGSYFIGFMSGLVGILLVKRHPDISAWFVLMVLAYPVVETFFSMYRRRFLRNKSMLHPDAMHLHTLIYKRIIKRQYKNTDPVIMNSLTSPYLWSLQIIASVFALFFWNKTSMLVLCFIVFSVFYVWYYFKILKPFRRRN